MLAFILLGATGFGLYALGRSNGASCTALTTHAATDWDQSSEIHAENVALRRQLSLLERTGQVQHAAYAKVNDMLKRLQNEVLELKEELAVYRRIVVHSDRGTGLRIQHLSLQPQGNARTYRYRVILTYLNKRLERLNGSMQLFVSGDRQDGSTVLSLGELSSIDHDDAEVDLQFKNFLRVEGQLTLPRAFTPHYVKVVVDGRGGVSQRAERTFTWQDVTS